MAAIAAIAVPLVAVAAFLILRAMDDSAEQARAAEHDFAAAWSRGDDALAGRLTDAPAAAAKALKTNRAGLDGAKVVVAPGPLKLDGDRGTGSMRVTWDVPAIGKYGYRAPVTVVKGKDTLARALRPAHDPSVADRDDAARHRYVERRAGPASSIATATRSCRSARSCVSGCSATR